MFNLITRIIRSPKHDVYTTVDVALPAIEGTNSKGNYKAVVDPNLSAQSILDTLLENWDEEDVKENMLSRFIAVLSDDPIRSAMVQYKVANPDASQDQIDEAMQEFADVGWNVNLQHPATDRKVKSIAKKQGESEAHISVMPTDAQAAFYLKLLKGNSELAAEVERQQKANEPSKAELAKLYKASEEKALASQKETEEYLTA